MWKVLVADDNFLNRKLLLEILKGKAQCDIAANGKEVLEAYEVSIKESHPYDAILLDVAMPEMNGVDVLKKIREQEQARGVGIGKGVVVIMVTAYKQPAVQAFGQGCDDYLVKPITAKDLLDKMEEKLPKK